MFFNTTQIDQSVLVSTCEHRCIIIFYRLVAMQNSIVIRRRKFCTRDDRNEDENQRERNKIHRNKRNVSSKSYKREEEKMERSVDASNTSDRWLAAWNSIGLRFSSHECLASHLEGMQHTVMSLIFWYAKKTRENSRSYSTYELRCRFPAKMSAKPTDPPLDWPPSLSPVE